MLQDCIRTDQYAAVDLVKVHMSFF